MAQARYLTRRTSAKWAAGSISVPTTAASYPVLSPSYNLAGAEVIPGLPTVGGYIPHFNRPGGRPAGCTFVSEMYGQPSNTVPMYYGALLRACGMKESVASTNFFTYSGPCAGDATFGANPHLLSDSAGDLDAVDLVMNIDNLDQFCHDAVGGVTFRGSAGGICTASFGFIGREKTGTSQVLSSVVGAAQTAHGTEVVSKAVRGAVSTVGGNAVVFLEWEYALNPTLDIRNDVNGEFAFSAPIITGFEPSWRVVFEAPAEGTYNPQDAFLAGSTVAMAIAHTTPATLSKFTWGWTGYWASLAQIGDRNGKAVWEGTGTQSDLTGPLKITTS